MIELLPAQRRWPLLFALVLVQGLLAGCGREPLTEAGTDAPPISDPDPPAPPTRYFVLPTPNQALLETAAEEQYFVGTVGRTWLSGTFGCVRSEGWQMHEGIDIRAVERDRRGEPTDPIYATADGTVVYINERAGLSTYGIYVVLAHQVQGWDLYSLYAHLASVGDGLRPGQAVRAGETLGIMGRTANTRQGISRERAHLHFELLLMLNDRFVAWQQQTYPGQRNDHGVWNGRNFVGIDPAAVLLQQYQDPARFDLGNIIRQQTLLCRVTVRVTDFPWLHRYPQFIEPNPTSDQEGIAGYELYLNHNGLPFRVIPRAASELGGRARFQVLEVNDFEYQQNPCRRLVRRRGAWELAPAGELRLNLLTH
jgi:peptidoglycan LD-endopeptidase LytH